MDLWSNQRWSTASTMTSQYHLHSAVTQNCQNQEWEWREHWQLYRYKGSDGNNKTDARTFWVGTYPWQVPVFTYEPLVFTQQEQFLRALAGFVSCVGINLLAKMLVVCEIIVIQNGPCTHIIDATSFVQKQCWESCGGRAFVVGIIFS